MITKSHANRESHANLKNRKSARASLAIILTFALIFTSIGFAPQAADISYGTDGRAAEIDLETHYTDGSMRICPIGTYVISDDTLAVRYYGDMPNVAYVKLEDLFALHEDRSPGDLTVECIGDHQYLVTNHVTSGTAVVDTLADTLQSEALRKFACTLNDDEMMNDTPWFQLQSINFIGNRAATIDFDDSYGIDLRSGSNGTDLYFPLATANDIFAYLDGNVMAWNGSAIYSQNPNKYDDYFVSEPTIDRETATIYLNESDTYRVFTDNMFSSYPTRPADLAEFAYKDLCFQMDYAYGYPGKEPAHSKLTNGQSFDEFLTGFTASGGAVRGSAIKALLKSTDWGEYFLGYDCLSILLDDKGHTYCDIDENIDYRLYEEIRQNGVAAAASNPAILEWLRESSATPEEEIYLYFTRKEQREAGFGLQPGQNYIESGDTAICILDTFSGNLADLNDMKDYYRTGVWPDESSTNPLAQFVNALNRAKVNPNIRNFVIDITNNGGGYTGFMVAVLAIINNEETCYEAFKDRYTGQIQLYTYKMDRNLDRAFDERDEAVSHNMNFILLQSSYSFSAANTFPMLMKESGHLILGERSGGGACAVQYLSTADGFRWRNSAASGVETNRAGSAEIDTGIEPDVELFTRDANGNRPVTSVYLSGSHYTVPRTIDYSEFYDIENLKRVIHTYFPEQPAASGGRRDKDGTASPEATAGQAEGTETTVTLSNISKVFTDMAGDEWYAESVAWAANSKLMRGIGGTTFDPEGIAQRAMIAQILFNLDSVESGAEGTGTAADPDLLAGLSDVAASDWFATPIAWALDAGIAKGRGKDFGATVPITREDDIVMLQNYAKYKGIDTGKTADLSIFADADTISPWAKEAVSWAVAEGLITGYTDRAGRLLLNPAGTATRGQIATIIKRFCENILNTER
jgi:hypothetical protein